MSSLTGLTRSVMLSLPDAARQPTAEIDVPHDAKPHEIKSLIRNQLIRVGLNPQSFSLDLVVKDIQRGATSVTVGKPRTTVTPPAPKEVSSTKPQQVGMQPAPQIDSSLLDVSLLKPVDDAPDKARVAASFTAQLKALGFDVYISGGAALHWQGGSRPIDDLDFRMQVGQHNVGNFEDPQGQALLRALNDLTRKMRAAGFQCEDFRPLGGGGLTVVSSNYCGQEISISLTNSAPEIARLRPELAELSALSTQLNDGASALMHISSKDVPALDLRELQSDKLKSMISRWKWGDDNIKKVSQDLFDFLEAVALDDDDVAKAVDRAATSRIDQYKRSNPFYTRLDHVPGSQLKDDIIGFVVLTAQAHITGKRRRAFEALCENSSNPEAMLARLEAIASISVQPEVKSRLRPWMQQWREREGPTGRRMPVKLPKIENENSVESILRIGTLHIDLSTLNMHRSNDQNIRQVLTILYGSGGMRPLDDSRNDFQTQLAFGLSATQFSNAYSALFNAGLVKGDAAGLHLTTAGCELVGLPRREYQGAYYT